MVYELTDRTYVLGYTLAITALQTKVITGRLLLIRIEDHKEHICCLSRCAWLVWAFRVFSMVQRVPTAGCCPYDSLRHRDKKSCMLLWSPGLFALDGSQRWQYLLSSAPLPRLLYAWDSFWQFPLATHCTACTPNHWSCNPHQAAPQMAMQWNAVKYEEHGRNHEDLLALLVAFNAEAMHQPRVLCPSSNLSACCGLVLLKTLVGKELNDQWQAKAVASSFTAYVHELSRWPQHYAIFSNIELTDTYVLGDTLAITALQTKIRQTLAHKTRRPQRTHLLFESLRMTCLSIQSIQHGATCANSRTLSYNSLRHRDKKSCMLLWSPGLFG